MMTYKAKLAFWYQYVVGRVDAYQGRRMVDEFETIMLAQYHYNQGKKND